MYLLTTWMDKISKKALKLEKLFDQFETEFCTYGNQYLMAQEIVDDATECHLRPPKNKKTKKVCMICQLDIALKKYELDIFLMKTKGKDKDEKNIGSWHPSFEERLIKSKYKITKNYFFSKFLITTFLIIDSKTQSFRSKMISFGLSFGPIRNLPQS